MNSIQLDGVVRDYTLQNITTLQLDNQDYISLTDIANAKDSERRAADIIKNWIRNRGTLEFIGTWEHL